MKPHEDRVVKEKQELDEKLAKLSEFGMTPLFASLPADEQERLNRQHSVMGEYSRILGERIAAWQAAESKHAKPEVTPLKERIHTLNQLQLETLDLIRKVRLQFQHLPHDPGMNDTEFLEQVVQPLEDKIYRDREIATGFPSRFGMVDPKQTPNTN